MATVEQAPDYNQALAALHSQQELLLARLDEILFFARGLFGRPFEFPGIGINLDASGNGDSHGSVQIADGQFFRLTRTTVADVTGTYTFFSPFAGGTVSLYKNAIGPDSFLGGAPAGPGGACIPAIFGDDWARAAFFGPQDKPIIAVRGGPPGGQLVCRIQGMLSIPS